METIVVVLKHQTRDVDLTRIEPMLLELNSVAQRYDFSVVASGSRELMAKVLTNGVLPVWPRSLKPAKPNNEA
jgi:hypothetical protein